MATNFPSSLDNLTNPTASDKLNSVTVPHATQHANVNDAVEALEAKVGVDGSAVTSSHDYILTNGVLPTLNVDSGVLVVDDTNNRVGVNDATPSYALDVTGDINATSDVKVGGDSLPRGVLASAKSTADFSSIGTSGTDIVNVSVTLSASRQLKVTGFTNVDAPSTNLYARVQIYDDPIATGNLLQDAGVSLGTGSGNANALNVVVIHFGTFAAGTHNFYLSAESSTGTFRANGNINGVSYHGIIVEDVGAA